MALAGNWLAGVTTPTAYAGATKWGTGVNPIHGVRDSGTRETGIKENLLPIGADDEGAFVPENIVGPEMWGYCAEDPAYSHGEDYRYLDDHPNWGEPPQRTEPSLAAGPPGTRRWPSWGPHGVADDDQDAWMLPAYPGGDNLRAVSEGAEIENARAIAVPTPGWRGGWVNKAHGRVEESETSDPSQYEITTSMAQLHQTRVNDAAVLRQTDDPRSSIKTRLTGQKIKVYAKSQGMGGGPGTPDMVQQGQDLPYRPWFYRTGAMPPPPDTTWGTITYFDPIERTLPVDSGETVVIQEAAPTNDGTYGYGDGDYVV